MAAAETNSVARSRRRTIGSLVFTCQGNKTNGGDLPGDHLIVIRFLQQQQLLGHEAAADRDDHAAAGCHDFAQGQFFYAKFYDLGEATKNAEVIRSLIYVLCEGSGI